MSRFPLHLLRLCRDPYFLSLLWVFWVDSCLSLGAIALWKGLVCLCLSRRIHFLLHLPQRLLSLKPIRGVLSHHLGSLLYSFWRRYESGWTFHWIKGLYSYILPDIQLRFQRCSLLRSMLSDQIIWQSSSSETSFNFNAHLNLWILPQSTQISW